MADRSQRLGFKITASDIKVSNGGLINLSYKAVDLGFGVHDKATDKMTVHVPLVLWPNIFNNSNKSIQSSGRGQGSSYLRMDFLLLLYFDPF
jgi:hypothetical protein